MESMASLVARTVLGFGALLVALGAALFLPAGTFDYWQAWVYLLVFGGSAAAITVYLGRHDPALLQRRVSGGPTAEHERRQQLIQVIASVAFVGLYVVAGLDRRFGWSHIPAVVSLAADVVVAFGFLIVFFVFRENTYTSATIEVAADQVVISSGPYAVVRHPMYSGALLLLLATPLALGSWWALLMFMPLCAVIVWRLTDEERFLVARLSGYAEYRGRVRSRLIPGVW
jgi:protein-S-isoprenylcysteine O-methyltransferase Ste14